jgi:hypothetical protein
MNRWRGSFFLVGALMTFPLLPAANGSPTALESATVSELKNRGELSGCRRIGTRRQGGRCGPGAGRGEDGRQFHGRVGISGWDIGAAGVAQRVHVSPESREVQTRSGLSVFFIPKGMGGLRIVSRAVVGAVEGCTVVVEEIERPQGANTQHWTKFLLVEGSRASVSLPNAKHTSSLRAGQGIFQREGASTLSPPFDFDVKALTENATIFTGFHRAWPGLDDINAVIEKQSGR